MSTTIDEIRACLDELEGEPLLAGSFNWNNTDYPCLVSSATKSKKLGAGGWATDADLTILVRRELFGDTTPVEKQRLVYLARTYNIDQIVSPTGEPFWKLVCNDPNRGA